MRVKTIQARSMVELLERVRAEIGPQAVLLNVRRMELDESDHDGGLLLEATAAFDPEALTESRSEHRTPVARTRTPAAYTDEFEDRIEIGHTPAVRPMPTNRVAHLRTAPAPVPTPAYVPREAPKATPESALPRPSQALFRKLGTDHSFKQDYASDAVFVLVGPSGSGKTTVAAKIAAWLRAHTQKQVGLINADPGNAESNGLLQHHAKMLGLPCTTARTASELRNRLAQWQRRGPILLDTPGLPTESSERLSVFAETLRRMDLPVETHLVMEADRSAASLLKCLRGYEPAGYSHVVLTGMDRSTQPANAVSHVMATKAPVSFLSAGADVSDGLEAASPAQLLKLFA